MQSSWKEAICHGKARGRHSEKCCESATNRLKLRLPMNTCGLRASCREGYSVMRMSIRSMGGTQLIVHSSFDPSYGIRIAVIILQPALSLVSHQEIPFPLVRRRRRSRPFIRIFYYFIVDPSDSTGMAVAISVLRSVGCGVLRTALQTSCSS